MLAKAWGFVPGLHWRTKLIFVRLVSDSIPGLCKYSRKWFYITLFDRALTFECSYLSEHSPFKSKWCPLMLGSALIFLLLVVKHRHTWGSWAHDLSLHLPFTRGGAIWDRALDKVSGWKFLRLLDFLFYI